MSFTAASVVNRHVIFVSSGDEMLVMRDRFEQLVTGVINPTLYLREYREQVFVDRWENTPPRRAAGDRINQEFVERALASDLIVVMIRDKLGEGTEEELLAVLDQPDGPDIAILWFPPTRSADAEELNRITALLEPYREQVLWCGPRSLGTIDSPETWFETFRLLLDFVLKTLQPTRRMEAPVEFR